MASVSEGIAFYQDFRCGGWQKYSEQNFEYDYFMLQLRVVVFQALLLFSFKYFLSF